MRKRAKETENKKKQKEKERERNREKERNREREKQIERKGKKEKEIEKSYGVWPGEFGRFDEGAQPYKRALSTLETQQHGPAVLHTPAKAKAGGNNGY